MLRKMNKVYAQSRLWPPPARKPIYPWWLQSAMYFCSSSLWLLVPMYQQSRKWGWLHRGCTNEHVQAMTTSNKGLAGWHSLKENFSFNIAKLSVCLQCQRAKPALTFGVTSCKLTVHVHTKTRTDKRTQCGHMVRNNSKHHGHLIIQVLIFFSFFVVFILQVLYDIQCMYICTKGAGCWKFV